MSTTANIAVLRGIVTSAPRRRELPSGSAVVQIEVTTRDTERTASVPVVVHDRPVQVDAGDEVVVVGHVRRRFFRAGGATQSRTEVVADRVVKATRRRAVDRAVASVVAALST